MVIAIIAAVDRNWLIGANGNLPWHAPADLRHFRDITTGHVVIMGRKTFESIGRALPNRLNIVISKTVNQKDNPEVLVFSSLKESLSYLEGVSCQKTIFVIGGESIYRQALEFANKLYITHIDGSYTGDVYFPDLGDVWEISNEEYLDSSPSSEPNMYFREYTRTCLER